MVPIDGLTSVVKAFHSQVKGALPEPAASYCHGFVPGNFVDIKTYKRKNRTPAKVDWTLPGVADTHCSEMPGSTNMDPFQLLQESQRSG